MVIIQPSSEGSRSMSDPEVRIRSVGTSLPGAPVDNAMLARRFGMNDAWRQWVDLFIGTRTRHFGFDIDTGDRHYTLADLGTEAGGKALEAAGVAPGDVDLLVMGTATPDQLMPATVNVIADRLGIDDLATFQLQSGCSGALQALDVAHQMLSTGRHRNALVIGAESVAKHYDADVRFDEGDSAYAVNTVLFGDGAGAAVLTTDAVPGAPVLRRAMVRLVGLGRAPGQTVDWYGMGDRQPESANPRSSVSEDYKEIEAEVPRMAGEILSELLDDLDWAPDEVDYLLPPQLSGRMTQQIVEHLGLPGLHEVSCVRELGNTGNATPFFQLERVLPRMVEGDRAVCISIESSKWIKAGFAVEKA
jgi:3-oxoacyl-[acyl-carrier-protein] synthase III